MSIRLPERLAEKARSFPESSMGANRVTLILADGRRVEQVTVAWGDEIVRVGARDVGAPGDVDFGVGDLVDVVCEAND